MFLVSAGELLWVFCVDRNYDPWVTVIMHLSYCLLNLHGYLLLYYVYLQIPLHLFVPHVEWCVHYSAMCIVLNNLETLNMIAHCLSPYGCSTCNHYLNDVS